MATRDVYLEVGTKRVFACSLDWPGWCRSGRTDDDAMAALADYAPRYAVVARAAGLRFPARVGGFEVVERIGGSGTTDFGAPGTPAAADRGRLTAARAGRLADLLEAAWKVFDGAVAGAPMKLRKGPRGGGRDRDAIVEHVLSSEVAYVRMLDPALRGHQPAPGDAAAVAAFRAAVAGTLRAARSGEPATERGWPPRYAARRIAWHVLDHAWEIEDKSEPPGT